MDPVGDRRASWSRVMATSGKDPTSAHPSNPQQTTTTRRRTLSAGSDDPLPGAPGEPEGGDGELGDDEESLIVRDGADEDENLVAVLVGVVRVLHNSRDGKRRSVRLGVKQALEDDLVELRVGSSGKEAVKLRGNESKRGDQRQPTQSLESKQEERRRERTFTSKRR